MSSPGDLKLIHVALLPSAGMGHLTPFLRLAASLAAHNVEVTVITPHPTVSQAESYTLSCFLTAFPRIAQQEFDLLQTDKHPANSEDPIYYHIEAIRNSSHLLLPLLTSLSPPLSAIITDMTLASDVIPITQALRLPNYVFFTSSAKMLTLFLSYHNMASSKCLAGLGEADTINMPGLERLPKSWIPRPLLEESDNVLKRSFMENGRKIVESHGILVNTVENFERETLRDLNGGKVIEGLTSVIAIGPLVPCHFEKSQPLAWLDEQPAGSVMYVSFGSRTALSREQVRELGEGLVKSGSRFLWLVKGKKVDKEDKEELDQVIGKDLVEKVKGKGLVVKHWLSQDDILSHPAVGGFLSHCGWNSVTEALWHGVPILAWPQHGDQKVNAGIVERIGLGKWHKNWEWEGQAMVNGEEIAGKVRELMGSESLRLEAMRLRQEARSSVDTTISSNKSLSELLGIWRKF